MPKLVALAALVACAVLSVSPAASRTAACGPSFAIVPSESTGHAHTNMLALDARSPSLAWAAGIWRNGDSNGPDLPMFERWNGASWKLIKGVVVSTTGDNDLYGVGIVSANEVWAAGAAWRGNSASTLVERWTPAGVKAVHSPSPGPSSYFNALSVVSAKNIWAVGEVDKGSKSKPLVQHWNGKKWTVVNAPGTGPLMGVDALSAKNVWAVGSTGGAKPRTLVEHWDGKHWKIVASPNASNVANVFRSVAGLAKKDVWAVGNSDPNNQIKSLIEHWDGKHWKIVPSPSPGTVQNFLYGVSAVSSRSVWAVGNETSSLYKTMALHWNGSSWTQEATPSPSNAYNFLGGVAALKSGTVFAVGDYNAGTEFDTLALRRCG
jgi:hypothetical protein